MDENDDAQMTLLTRALERTSCTMWEFAQHARRFTEIVAVINAGWSRSVDLNDVSLDAMVWWADDVQRVEARGGGCAWPDGCGVEAHEGKPWHSVWCRWSEATTR